jgi:hypothetical protein
MSDPLRGDTRSVLGSSDPLDRDAKIEQLLLQGLDHYFSAQLDQAIHVWTRVLFLDRGHARARAYIERARSAIAERQRESEELLQQALEAFHAGDAAKARALLISALDRGGPNEVTLSVLERLDRLDGGNARLPGHTAPGARAHRAPPAEDAAAPAPSRRWALPAVLLAAVVALGLYAIHASDLMTTIVSVSSRARAAPAAVHGEPLPVPSGSAVRLQRARALFERGRLHDALRELDLVPPGDRARDEADHLKAAVQRSLLSGEGVLPIAPLPDAVP